MSDRSWRKRVYGSRLAATFPEPGAQSNLNWESPGQRLGSFLTVALGERTQLCLDWAFVQAAKEFGGDELAVTEAKEVAQS